MRNGKIQCWIIYPEYVLQRRDNAFEWLREEASRAGIELHTLIIERMGVCYGSSQQLFYDGSPIIEYPDFVIIRTYDSVITRFFENRGIEVINSSRSMELCKNKMLTHEILSCNGIPTPQTYYSAEGRYDYTMLSDIFSDAEFIVKRTDGAKGENVYLVGSEQELENAVAACRGNCICQKFIRTSRGRDIRIWVLDGKVIGSVLRHSETSFISNFSQGGHATAFTPTAEAATLAIRSAQTLGIRFSGIDLLFDGDGFVLNEINGNAGFRTLSLVGDNSLPRQLFNHLREISNPLNIHR